MNTPSLILTRQSEVNSSETLVVPQKAMRPITEVTNQHKKISIESEELATNCSLFSALLQPPLTIYQPFDDNTPEQLPLRQALQHSLLLGHTSITTEGEQTFERALSGVLQSSEDQEIEASLLIPSLGTVQITAGPQNRPWLITITPASYEVARWFNARRLTLETSLSQTLKIPVELLLVREKKK